MCFFTVYTGSITYCDNLYMKIPKVKFNRWAKYLEMCFWFTELAGVPSLMLNRCTSLGSIMQTMKVFYQGRRSGQLPLLFCNRCTNSAYLVLLRLFSRAAPG